MLKVRRFAGGQLFGRNTLGDPVLLVLFPPLDASFFLQWGCWTLPIRWKQEVPVIVIVNRSFFKVFSLIATCQPPTKQ
jgi:hypothetical protein